MGWRGGGGGAEGKENVKEMWEACNKEFGITLGRKRKALKETKPIRKKMKSECLQILEKKNTGFKKSTEQLSWEASDESNIPSLPPTPEDFVQERPLLATRCNHRGALKPRTLGPTHFQRASLNGSQVWPDCWDFKTPQVILVSSQD